MRRFPTLAAQILIGVLGILILTTALGGYLYVTLSARTLDRQYEQRAVGIAKTVAENNDVRTTLRAGHATAAIQVLAQRVAHSTGAAYVVITDRWGVRYSHPNPALIGRRLEEGVAVLDGHDHVGIDHGSLGRSANGKAPLFDGNGQVLGEVSVGILEAQVAIQQRHEVEVIVALSLAVLGFGAAASWLLARRIKRVTFGLELDEIAQLLQEREAMLHGIREGVIGFDRKGRINVISVEAQRLLRLSPSATGRFLDELLPPGRLRGLLDGTITGTDQLVLTDDLLLVVNRMPVVLGERNVGYVVTLRDRTELEAVIRELHAVTGLTDALRAQEHEYANRLHIMAGLLEFGEREEAATYLAEISTGSAARAEDLRSRIAPATVAMLLLAKVAVAAEQGITLIITPDSHLSQPALDARVLQTVIGNLIDNALEALAGAPQPREVRVYIRDNDALHIIVSDTGPGVAAAEIHRVFDDGYTTKTDRGEMRRGLGLALVHRIVRRAGGTIDVIAGPGAQFRVTLPIRGTVPAAAVESVPARA